MIDINIINKSSNQNPTYGTEEAAGLDLRADNEIPIIISPMERVMIPINIHTKIPNGCVGMVCPRSGLAAKHGITVLNAPGIIDPDFIGNYHVILINLSQDEFPINKGDRIAQLVILQYQKVNFVNVEELETTERGQGGFGSTGLQ